MRQRRMTIATWRSLGERISQQSASPMMVLGSQAISFNCRQPDNSSSQPQGFPNERGLLLNVCLVNPKLAGHKQKVSVQCGHSAWNMLQTANG